MMRISATIFFLAVIHFIFGEGSFQLILPIITALISLLVTGRAVLSLMLGSISGALLASQFQFFETITQLISIVSGVLSSSWNLYVLAATLLIGGFASLVEFGGGLNALLTACLPEGRVTRRRVESLAFLGGFICFFDGLANSLLVGRISKPLADQAGVSRLRLAYIVDSTSAPVACISLVSTWIAFQLSLIHQSLLEANSQVSAYSLFLYSIPRNFYCWFALALVLLTILFKDERDVNVEIVLEQSPALKRVAIIPLLALGSALLVFMYMSGAEGKLPWSFDQFLEAIGSANAASSLFYASLVGAICAALMNSEKGVKANSNAFGLGIRQLAPAGLLLISAWIYSSVLKTLGVAESAQQLFGAGSEDFLAVWVFVAGTFISFISGTSWGTMALLSPFAFSLVLEQSPDDVHAIGSVVAAVFSGAVFGDHCSPISDTTLVSSLACGADPVEHVKKQLPLALLAAAASLFSFSTYGLSGNLLFSFAFGSSILSGVFFYRPFRRKYC